MRHSSKVNNWLNPGLILLISALCLAGGRSASAQQIKVMQWNVEGNDGKGLGRLSNNTNAQTRANARIVNYNQPDVLLFNEIDASNNLSAASNEAALTDWITNNVPYLGTQPGATFFVKASSTSDGFIRNAVVSRFPILAEGTYVNSQKIVRGLHAFRVQLEGTNVLQIFHAHLKALGTTSDCVERQTNAVFTSTTIRSWTATNSLPYIFAGDWNEDESAPQCTVNATYAPITMIRTNGNLVEFRPTDLDAVYKTEGTPFPDIRFDYCLAGSNRLAAVSGYVFNSTDWAANGFYTNASPQNLSDDSTTASDHCAVFVTYSFPASVTNFSVTPTNAFISSGNEAGPFSPSSQTYALTNSDTIPLFWSVIRTSNWLTISTLATNLTLAAGASTNITAFINNSAANSLPGGGVYTDTIVFSNTATGVAFSRGVTLTVNATPPLASFTGSPTNGSSPLMVTFTDTSTGSITNRFWDFGDSSTTNVTTNSVAHVYNAGTFSVTLTASGPLGSSTNTKPNYITVVLPPSTVTVIAADLQDQFANLMPSTGVAVLVADTGANGFVDPQPAFPVNLGAIWGADDQVVGLWDLQNSFAFWGQPGGLADQTIVAYTNGIAAGQKLQLYWFPSLTLASNTVGVTYYGKYTDTNSPPLNGSAPWSVPASGSTVELDFLTQSEGGSNPDPTGEATFLTTGALTPFESWQIQYFSDTNSAAGAPSADPDGDGQNNMAEFLLGTDPTNNASGFRIQSIFPEGNNLRITWTMGSGRTNALQLSNGAANGNYATNFTDIFTVTNTVGSVTNYLDVGAATNAPARYYRVRLVP